MRTTWIRFVGALRNKRKMSIFALFFLLAAISNNVWFPPAVIFKATIESEKRLVAQIFYADGDNPGSFSAEHMINIMVPEGKSRLVVPIPAKRVIGFRMDFGWEPGRIRLSTPRLSGRSTAWLNTGGFVFSKDVIEHSAVSPDTIDIAFRKGDPYAVYRPRFAVDQTKRVETLFKLMPLATLFLLFLYLASRFMVRNAADSAMLVGRNWRSDGGWTKEGGWISSFDIVRVVAFLFVVFSHLLSHVDAHGLPLRLQVHLMPWGAIGVSFFIILSGASLSVGSFRRKESWISFYLRRLRTLLPPFWVAYFVCLMLQFGVFGTTSMGRSLLSSIPTLFGIDGYLSHMVPTYAMIGEWYLGFILLLYMLAPTIHRIVERTPFVALASLFAVSILAARMTPLLREYVPFWNNTPRFNVLSHVFEFAFGMFFVRRLRPGFRRYAVFALLSGTAVVAHLLFAKGPWFDFTPVGILMSVAAFVAMCFSFDSCVLGKAASDVFASLGRTSFLAFLYHHKVIGWLVAQGKQIDNFQLAYCFLLTVAVSYVLAFVSLKPADLLARLVFGEKRNRIQ